MITLIVVAGIMVGGTDQIAGQLTYNMDFPSRAACERALENSGGSLEDVLAQTIQDNFRGALAGLESYRIETSSGCHRL